MNLANQACFDPHQSAQSRRNADGLVTTAQATLDSVRHMSNTQTIGVIGAGTIPNGIAQVCLLAGLSVVMLDVDEGWPAI